MCIVTIIIIIVFLLFFFFFFFLDYYYCCFVLPPQLEQLLPDAWAPLPLRLNWIIPGRRCESGVRMNSVRALDCCSVRIWNGNPCGHDAVVPAQDQRTSTICD